MGATLAELVLPAGATRAARRTFFIAGVVAANLPDADLVYTRITPAPLGALLHHRGHRHTIVGLAVLGAAMVAVCALPKIRQSVEPWRGRLWALIAIALASHLILDSWNSYGIHPFWPISTRWIYGDAVYILEPWLWLFLGVAATLNTVSRTGRGLLGATLALLLGAGAWLGVIPIVAVLALAAVALAYAALVWRATPQRRSSVGLALALGFVGSLFATREVVRAKVHASPPPGMRGRIVDVVLSPEAANPLCWSALSIASDESAGEYVMTRASVTPLGASGCGRAGGRAVHWDDPLPQSLARLRALHRDDCWVRAWLQFGRAPEITTATISDYRYGRGTRGNFTMMPLRPPAAAAVCPANLTDWRPPRGDLLGVLDR
jgi:inner membrane protein